jgi:hypothetical protein
MPIVWILAALAVIFIAETVFIEVEQWGWATLILIATVVGCHFLTPFDPLAFIKTQGPFTVVYVLGYLAVGVGWSFVKWFSYLRAFRDSFREQKESFCKDKSLDASQPIPDKYLDAFKEYLRSHARYTTDRKTYDQLLSLERPRSINNKSRITAWMAYWPCSAIGTLLNDPVRRLFNFLFSQFKALYQKLSDHVFRNDVELK